MQDPNILYCRQNHTCIAPLIRKIGHKSYIGKFHLNRDKSLMSAHLSKNHIKQCYFGRVMLQVYLYTEMSKRFKVNLYEISAIDNIQQAGNHLDPITIVLRLSFCLQKQSKLTEVMASALLSKRYQGSNSLLLEKLHLKRFGSLLSFCQ